MAEAESATSNYQRLEEMFIHLTPIGATVPYSLCIDMENCIWVASKGGLFKFNADGKLLFSWKKKPPAQISAHCQVHCFEQKILFAIADDKSELTELKILDYDGHVLSEQFIDGKIRCLSVSENGKFFIIKHFKGGDSTIQMSDVDRPINWECTIAEDEFAFQALCAIDSNTLVVATCAVPINIYSKQHLRFIDVSKQIVTKSFSKSGKGDGEIYFPRSIQRYENELLVLDKTGRIQVFDMSGKFVRIAAKIDAYIGNGFITDGDQAIIACSGIVLDKDQNSICDHWLEKMGLNGSCWTPSSRLESRS